MRAYRLVSKSELRYARESIYDRDDFTCQICKLNFKKKSKTHTKKNIDHIIPRSIFSWSHPFNLQLLCKNCNAEKSSDLLPDYWDVIEKNIDRSVKWFIKQEPEFSKDETKFMLWKLKMKSRDGYYPFSIDKYHEVFSLYYDDKYINRVTGVFNDVFNDASKLPNDCISMFTKKMEELIDNTYGQTVVSLIVNKNPAYEKSKKARDVIYWLKSLSYKLEAINEYDLASRCEGHKADIDDKFYRGRHVRGLYE